MKTKLHYMPIGKKGQTKINGEVIYWEVIGDQDNVKLSNGHEGYLRPNGNIMITG